MRARHYLAGGLIGISLAVSLPLLAQDLIPGFVATGLSRTEADASYLALDGGTMSGPIAMGGQPITGGGAVTASGLTVSSSAGLVTSGNTSLVINSGGTGKVDIRDLVQIGDGTYSWGNSPTGLAVEGYVELDGRLYCDDSIYQTAGKLLQIGGTVATTMQFATNLARAEAWLGVGSTFSSTLVLGKPVVGSVAMYGKDHDFADLGYMRICLVGSVDPDTNNTRYGCLGHSGTAGAAGNFRLESGSGDVYLLPATKAVRMDGTSCGGLPVAGTAYRMVPVSDAGASDRAGLCVDDGTSWLIADGSGDLCCP